VQPARQFESLDSEDLQGDATTVSASPFDEDEPTRTG
jgi:hypothetical protein